MTPSNHPHLLNVDFALGSTSFKSRNQSKLTFLPLFPAHRRRPHPLPSHWICRTLATRLLALPATTLPHRSALVTAIIHPPCTIVLTLFIWPCCLTRTRSQSPEAKTDLFFFSPLPNFPIHNVLRFQFLGWFTVYLGWFMILVGPQQVYFSL